MLLFYCCVLLEIKLTTTTIYRCSRLSLGMDDNKVHPNQILLDYLPTMWPKLNHFNLSGPSLKWVEYNKQCIFWTDGIISQIWNYNANLNLGLLFTLTMKYQFCTHYVFQVSFKFHYGDQRHHFKHTFYIVSYVWCYSVSKSMSCQYVYNWGFLLRHIFCTKTWNTCQDMWSFHNGSNTIGMVRSIVGDTSGIVLWVAANKKQTVSIVIWGPNLHISKMAAIRPAERQFGITQ